MDKKWRDDNALSRVFCREERTPALERDKERERESFLLLLLLLRRGRGDAFDDASSFCGGGGVLLRSSVSSEY